MSSAKDWIDETISSFLRDPLPRPVAPVAAVRADLVFQVEKQDPEEADNRIADWVGASSHTVEAVRAELCKLQSSEEEAERLNPPPPRPAT